MLDTVAGEKAIVEPTFAPIEGAWVCRRGRPEQIGIVVAREETGLRVDFGDGAPVLLKKGDWNCGLRPGFIVQDVPLSAVRATLGLGTVVSIRSLCDREQVLVHFHGNGQSRWLPFERLRRWMGPRHSFIRAAQHDDQPAERVALNAMAHALRLWNEATGALDRLDVDPLPHQISLVHKIMTSGTTNWLIADDVGLGKTIEIGLLLAALERRRSVRRVLIVVPAGLTRQWQDEMEAKFDKRFLIYGRDFDIQSPKDWPRYERVIVSLDLAKPQTIEDTGIDPGTRYGMLLGAGTWDAIVFDEAHRLSRGERGQTTLRYRLAAALRAKTDALLLLTGTPHQGDTARFQNLLTLVRPDSAAAIQMLEFNPEIVREMIIRNRKIDAVDADGKFIFRGAIVRRVLVPLTDGPRDLERLLRDYFRRGYAASERIGGSKGRAVGFVMTIYRKLASSSVFALAVALMKRRGRLIEARVDDEVREAASFAEAEDPTELGEADDLLSDITIAGTTTPFFADEVAWLDQLIAKARACFSDDPKRAELIRTVADLVVTKRQKLLIFTEYRSTQEYLRLALEKLGSKTVLINGGQGLDEKRRAIENFEGEADVLISTEAGGEGLNLHRRCHVMINYDLPWNPSRLTQRIGRLYRYGQKQQVIVLNFHAHDTIDNEILDGVMERLDRVVSGMAAVNAEFSEGYYIEVLGELLERLDIGELLAEAQEGRVERSNERIEAAIAAAQQAKSMQDEVLQGAERHDPEGWKDLGALSTAHLASFIRRAAPFLEVDVEPGRDVESFTLRLPAALRGIFPEFGGRTVIEASTRRGSTARRAQAEMMDFASSFVRHLVSAVTAPEFHGAYGVLDSPEQSGRLTGVFLSRFQNDQGRPTGQDLIVAVKQADGRMAVDNSSLLELFLERQLSAAKPVSHASARTIAIDALADRAEIEMAERCTRFQHPNGLVCVAVIEGGSP